MKTSHIKEQKKLNPAHNKNIDTTAQKHQLPDFAARRREIFGDRVVPDSAPIFEELREDRF